MDARKERDQVKSAFRSMMHHFLRLVVRPRSSVAIGIRISKSETDSTIDENAEIHRSECSPTLKDPYTFRTTRSIFFISSRRQVPFTHVPKVSKHTPRTTREYLESVVWFNCDNSKDGSLASACFFNTVSNENVDTERSLCGSFTPRRFDFAEKHAQHQVLRKAFRFNYQQVCYMTAFYVSHSISVVVGENGISPRRPFSSLRRHPPHRCYSSFTKRGYRENKWRSASKLFLSRWSIRQSLGVKKKRKKEKKRG